MKAIRRLSIIRPFIVLLAFPLLAGAVVIGARGAQECTTAVFSGAATPDGRPILWKNRDTDTLSNKVVHVDDKPFSYLGVVNAQDPDG